MSLELRIHDLRKAMTETAEACGRSSQDIQLVLVTKTVPAARIREAYQAGERNFGENRVQEWLEKKDELPSDIRWHLIGHLQTNKAKYVVGKIALIHSLDRLELAEALEKQAQTRGVSEVPCLVQVNLSGEESKFGLDPANVPEFLRVMNGRNLIKIRGMMVIGPLTDDEKKIQDCFRHARQLFDELGQQYPRHDWKILSMGMSGDFQLAIREGSNLLRVGTLVFGDRKR